VYILDKQLTNGAFYDKSAKFAQMCIHMV